MPSIFTRIIAGEIPGAFVFQDDAWVALLDIRPVNPGHCLLIPRHEAAYLADLPPAVLASLGGHVARLTRTVKSATGAPAVNVVVNDGPEAGQEVPHCHLHVIPRHAGDGKRLAWPAAPYPPGALEAMAVALRAAW